MQIRRPPSSRGSAGLGAAAGILFGLLALSFVLPAVPHDGATMSPPPVPTSGTHDEMVRTSPHAAGMTLGFDGVTPSAISLNWTATTLFLPSGYTIYDSSNSSAGPWTPVDTLTNAQTVTAAITGLSPGGTYWWQINASSAFGGTQSSNVLQVAQAPLALLTSPGNTSTSIQLAWTNSATYGGLLTFGNYAVEESENGSAPTTVTSLGNVTNVTYTVSPLTPGSSYSFFVTTTDCPTGCAPGLPTQSNTLTAGTALTLSASVTAQQTVADVGQPDFFVCTPSGGVSPFSFAWDNGSGSFVAGNSSQSFVFGAAGSIPVTCQITDASHARAAAAVTVIVSERPSVTQHLNRTQVDAGQAIAFSCSAENGSAPLAVGWNFGDGNSAGNANTSYAYSIAGQFSAQCSARDGAGVTVTAATAVNVSAALTVAIGASSAASAPGVPLTFRAEVTNGSGVYTTYTWKFGDGTQGTGAQVIHAFATGSPTVTLQVSDSYGGTASASLPLSISPVTARASESSTGISVRTAVTFSAVAGGGAGGPYNYSWNFGDGTPMAYGPSIVHWFNHTGTFAPHLTVTDRLGSGNNSTLAAVSVTTPTSSAPSTAWLLLLALLVAIAAGLLAWMVARRRSGRRNNEALSRWIPPAGPAGTVAGPRVCPACGESNVASRTTCTACGRTLPR